MGVDYHRAACAGTELEFFGHTPTKAVISCCRGCPIRWGCLSDALRRESRDECGEHGVWGGYSRRARLALLDRTGGNADDALLLAYQAEQPDEPIPEAAGAGR